jgi:eukaryotic-like serine/threonine-protein kinase
MTSVNPVTSQPNRSPASTPTLRARLDALRAKGAPLNLKQAVGVVVPLSTQLAGLHKNGRLVFVHPGNLVEDEYGFYHLDEGLASQPPANARDQACMAPEERKGQPGNARSSVFALGAILYELVTGETVGPGMRRPSDISPGLPPELELLLSKALVSDPAHRPDDLLALGQALYELAPTGSIRPPAADTKHLDQGDGFAVDVSLSMLPPTKQPGSPYSIAVLEVAPVPPPPASDATSALASLKDRLESDPRPRYVVAKDGMDHGPFSAVELLQQIANHTFVEGDLVRDSLSREEHVIKDWPQFAPFADHAKRHRDIKAEKEAIERVVVQETRSTRGKATLGVIVVLVLLGAAGAWYLTARGMKSDEIAVHGETQTNIESDGGLTKTKGKGGGGGSRVVGKSGNYPILSSGMSCEQAQSAYVEEMSIGGPRGQADLTAGAYGAVLNNGSYLGGCGVPDSMSVSICAAVQNGRAVGVTVSTNPRNPKVSSCVSGAVRRLSFPSHPKLDVTRTSF